MDVKVKEELKMGLEAANQLRLLLAAEQSRGGEGVEGGGEREEEAENKTLVACMKRQSSIILRTFDSAISLLKTAQVLQDAANNGNSKRSYPNRRASSLPEPSKIINTIAETEDGYSWRKYGQKSIANAKHPREYYRCGQKEEKGCRATKQVQIATENPTTYNIVYYGHHTCQHHLLNNEDNSPNMLNFQSYSYSNSNSNSTSFDVKQGPNPRNQDHQEEEKKPSSSSVLEPPPKHESQPSISPGDNLTVTENLEEWWRSYPNSSMFSPYGNSIDKVDSSCLMDYDWAANNHDELDGLHLWDN